MKWGIFGILLILIVVPYVNAYTFDYYLTDSGAATEIEQSVNFDSVDYCNFTIRSYFDNGTSPVTSEFYQPYDTYIIYSESSTTGNCAFGGKQTYNNDLDGFIEHETQHDNVTYGYQRITADCDAGSDFIIDISPATLDSENYYSGMFTKSGAGVYPPVADKSFNNDTYIPETCHNETYARHYNISTCTPACNQFSWTPFVAGYNQTRIRVSATGNGASMSMRLIVYPFNDTSTELYNNFLEAATVSWDINLTTLVEDQTYIVETAAYIVNPTTQYNFTEFIITALDVDPDWDCTDWAACDDETDTQERTCTDLNGIIESYNEYRACVSDPEDFDEFVYIGWRNLTSYDVPVCIPNWTITGCNNYVVNKSVYMPQDWTIVTSETLADQLAGQYPYRLYSWVDNGGFKFRMWNRPPKTNEARFNYSGTGLWECINVTSYSPTWETKNVSNASMLTQFNITFPEDNMQVWFTLKTCATQQHQYTHEDSASWFGINCGELCYSGSCSDEVMGGFQFQIYDLDDSVEMFRYDGNAVNDWRSYYFDISDAALEAGTTYRIQISTHDPDFTTSGTCLEFWDFGYGISSGAFACSNYCSDETFHYFRATTNAQGFCVFEDMGYSDECISNKAYESYIASCENFCDDAGDYHIGDNSSGICFWTLEEDATLCETRQSPETTLIPSATASTLDAYGLGIINFLVSIQSFVYIFMAVICFGAAAYFKPAAFIGILFVVVLLATGGYLPAYILLIIAVGAFVMFARSFVDVSTGGG